jgi:hypothetical protein
MSKFKIDLALPNGRKYEDGAGININLICSLKEIKRFPSFSVPGKFSVPEHLWLCAILVPAYCDYLFHNLKGTDFSSKCETTKFRYDLMQKVLTHDLEEVVFNDIPLPIKIVELENSKNIVRMTFTDWLSMAVEEDEIIEMSLKHIDCLAAAIESAWYINIHGCKNVTGVYDYYYSKLIEFGIEELFTQLRVPLEK